MAYTIVKSDGTTLTTIANGTINTSSTSVALPGRNYAGYGEYLDTNFVHMLENFADNTVPANPLRGQLWYNTTTSTMYICPTDGDTNAANWYAITTTSSGGNATLGNLTVTGNLLANNITATNNLDANSISCNYLTVNVNANMANANFSGTANATLLRTTAITTGSQSTNGILTGVWTANGAGTPVGGPSGTSFYVTGGNLVISNTSSRGVVADFFYYSNGTPISFGGGGTYSNSNVAAYLPTYSGIVGDGTGTLRGLSLSTGATANPGTVTGNWTLAAGSKWQANTVTDSAQPNITSVGTLSSLNVSANITAGNVFANTGVIKAAYLQGDGSGITNITVAAGTSIVNGTSNVVVDASADIRIGSAGTPNVLRVSSSGANVTGYANITTNAFIGANANVIGNVNAGNLVGPLANGTSNVNIPAASGNVNISAASVSNVLVVTQFGANLTGNANITGNANTGNIGANNGVFTTVIGALTNGTSNVNILNGGNVRVVVAGTTRINTTASGATVTGALEVSGSGAIITSSGNIQANLGGYFVGDGGFLSNISAAAGSSIVNGTSNAVVTLNGNVTVGVAGGASRLVVTSTGTNIAGYCNVVGNANIGNVGTATVIATTAANTPLVQNGTSNVAIASGGSVTVGVGGSAARLTVATTGISVNGTATTSGTMICGNVLTINSTTGTEGAQIVLAYANTTGLTGASANTWNVDVFTANTFRVFRNTAGTSLTAITFAESNGLATFYGNITGTSANLQVTGNLLASADIIAYSTSDSRLKENIIPIENALDKIKKISGVMFDWKDGHELDRKHDTGLIAQEVEEVLPEVIVTRPSGYKAVRYEKIIGLVVQAIKELADQVDELKKR